MKTSQDPEEPDWRWKRTGNAQQLASHYKTIFNRTASQQAPAQPQAGERPPDDREGSRDLARPFRQHTYAEQPSLRVQAPVSSLKHKLHLELTAHARPVPPQPSDERLDARTGEQHLQPLSLRSELPSPQALRTVSQQAPEPGPPSDRTGSFVRGAGTAEGVRPPANRPPVKHLAAVGGRASGSKLAREAQGPQSPNHSFQEHTLPTEPSSHEQLRPWPMTAHLQQESAPIVIQFGAGSEPSDRHRPGHSGDLSSPGCRSLLRADKPLDCSAEDAASSRLCSPRQGPQVRRA